MARSNENLPNLAVCVLPALDDDPLSHDAVFIDVSIYLHMTADIISCCPTSIFIPHFSRLRKLLISS